MPGQDLRLITPTDQLEHCMGLSVLTLSRFDLVNPLFLSFLIFPAPSPSTHPFLSIFVEYVPIPLLMGDPLGFGESFPFRFRFRLWQTLLAWKFGLRCWRVDHGSKRGRGGGKGEERRNKGLSGSESE